MLANRVRETTATTGTTNFVLAGAVAKFRAFSDKFLITWRFTYWAVNDADEEWETGAGYLTVSGGVYTLVRETVIDNSAGGTTKITFTTAPLLFCEGDAISGVNSISGTPANSFFSGHVRPVTDEVMTANRLYITPLALMFPTNIVEAGVNLRAGNGTAIIRAGIYQRLSDGDTYILLAEGTSTIAAGTGASTGYQVSTLDTALLLPIGVFFLGIISDGTPTAYRADSTTVAADAQVFGMYSGNNEPFKSCTKVISSGWSAMPATITGTTRDAAVSVMGVIGT